MKQYNSIVVCGPTACGKTSLGVGLASRLDGVVLSADSRQVYRGMDIGTGKDLSEYNRDGRTIPVKLVDIVEPGDVYTLYRYLSDFNVAFNGTQAEKKLPVIVGGTGLYVEGAIKQYEVPQAPEDAALRGTLMMKHQDDLERQLQDLSPEIYAKTDLSSKKRIVRAIEVVLTGGTCDLPIRVSLHEPMSPYVIGIAPPRETLLAAIDRRLDARLAEGMVGEVERIIASGVPRERMLMFGMEYKFVALYLYGELSYPQMVEALRASIHRLSKRQMTWFRGMERRGIPVCWYESADSETVLADILPQFR